MAQWTGIIVFTIVETDRLPAVVESILKEKGQEKILLLVTADGGRWESGDLKINSFTAASSDERVEEYYPKARSFLDSQIQP